MPEAAFLSEEALRRLMNEGRLFAGTSFDQPAYLSPPDRVP